MYGYAGTAGADAVLRLRLYKSGNAHRCLHLSIRQILFGGVGLSPVSFYFSGTASRITNVNSYGFIVAVSAGLVKC